MPRPRRRRQSGKGRRPAAGGDRVAGAPLPSHAMPAARESKGASARVRPVATRNCLGVRRWTVTAGRPPVRRQFQAEPSTSECETAVTSLLRRILMPSLRKTLASSSPASGSSRESKRGPAQHHGHLGAKAGERLRQLHGNGAATPKLPAIPAPIRAWTASRLVQNGVPPGPGRAGRRGSCPG